MTRCGSTTGNRVWIRIRLSLWMRPSRDSSAEPSAAGVEYVNLDLSQPVDPGCLPERIDAVVHLAQKETLAGGCSPVLPEITVTCAPASYAARATA